MEKNVGYYANLPYTIELQRDQEEGWFVRVKELPGCMSQGDTPDEALTMIQEAMLGWLEVSLEAGHTIPEPQSDDGYSGRFVVRVPRSLHRRLVEAAAADSVSLNQFISVTLAQAVGQQLSSTTSAPRDMEGTRSRSIKRRQFAPRPTTELHEGKADYTSGEGQPG